MMVNKLFAFLTLTNAHYLQQVLTFYPYSYLLGQLKLTVC